MVNVLSRCSATILRTLAFSALSEAKHFPRRQFLEGVFLQVAKHVSNCENMLREADCFWNAINGFRCSSNFKSVHCKADHITGEKTL